MVEEGVISAKDLALFDFAENAEDVWEKLSAAGVGLHEGEQAGGL